MPPIAVTPNGEKASDLTATGIHAALKKTAPTQADTTASSTAPTPLQVLDASLLQCDYVPEDKLLPLPSEETDHQAQWHKSTDHMIRAQWTSTTGWSAPTLSAYGPITLSPMASCLHYATECFEGMKLYRGFDGKLRLFRPLLNCKRMLLSTSRIALPGFEPEEVLKLITKLCATDGKRWLPKDQPGKFLYIRPTLIGTEASIGVQRPNEALLYVFLAVLPTLAPTKGGIKLLASQDDMVRAWPGGFGYAKLGANYGPSLVAQGEARRRGYDQVLWLYGKEGGGVVTEAGASNFFVVLRTKESRLQLVTASLDERIVLDGVTRRSVLEIARSKDATQKAGLEELEVVERKYTMNEIEEAAAEGRLVEAFAAGTAWFIAPVGTVHFRGKDIEIPLQGGEIGAYSKMLKEVLTGVMWGREGYEGHEWGYVIEES